MYIYIEIYILVYVFGCTQQGQQFSANRQPKKTTNRQRKKTKNLSLRMVKYNHIHGASILSTTLKTLLILCKFQHSSLRTILKTDIV